MKATPTKKIILILFLLLAFLFHSPFSSECRADEDNSGLVALVLTTSLATAAINGGFMALNVVNVAKPKPMGPGGKFFTGTGIAVGSATTAGSIVLAVSFCDNSPKAGLFALGSLVGLGTVGTGIWSLVVDRQQRKNLSAINFVPLAYDKNKTMPGLTVSLTF